MVIKCHAFNIEQIQSAHNGTSNERLNVSSASPTFKKPNWNVKEQANQRRNPLQGPIKSNIQHEAEDGKFSHV